MRIHISFTAAVATAFLTATLTSCSNGTTAATKMPANGSIASIAKAAPSASPAPSSPTPTPTPSPSPTDTGPGAQLMSQVLPLPAGAHEWPQDTHSLDLDGFVHAFYLPDVVQDEIGLGTRRGFVVAAERGWRASDGSEAYIYLIQFTASSGAESMYDGTSGNWHDDAAGGTVFTDSADDALGRLEPKLDKYGNADARVVAKRGNLLIHIKYLTPATPDQAGAEALMHQQLAYLDNPTSQPAA